MQQIPEQLRNKHNTKVLKRIKAYSAHSDVAGALCEAAAPLLGASTYEEAPHAPVIVYTGKIVFAVAYGMQAIALRLDETMKQRALASGAQEQSAYGPGWVGFTLFRSDWPEVDLKFWVRKAYMHARDHFPADADG